MRAASIRASACAVIVPAQGTSAVRYSARLPSSASAGRAAGAAWKNSESAGLAARAPAQPPSSSRATRDRCSSGTPKNGSPSTPSGAATPSRRTWAMVRPVARRTVSPTMWPKVSAW
nr:hypothetical protein [Actinoallomurus iriomotensis]